MKNHLVKLSAIGLVGGLLLQANTIPVMAQQNIWTDHISVAGVSVALDAYAQASEEEKTETVSGSAVENTEEIKFNIKYDRLGIAKVDNELNVRAKANQSAKIVAKMKKNAACNVEKITKDGWAKIKSGDVKGYVLAEYLVMDEEAEKLALKVAKKIAVVNTETLNARFLPSTQSAKYTLIPNGEELEVVKENLSEKYVSNFISKHFKKKDTKEYIKDVDQKAMKDMLENWICVSLDDEKVFVSKEFVTFSYELKKAVSTKKPKASSKSSNSTSGSSNGSARENMVSYAKQFLGNPYVYGGNSLTHGIDCSGFTQQIYGHYGYGLPRTAAAQAGAVRGISSSEAKPGDLFFYGSAGSVTHVAMYIGGGQVIHASTKRTGIKISNAFYRTPVKVGRVMAD